MVQTLKDSIRQELHQSALGVFADAGYARATLKRIASAARISVGNIYRYYPDKEALFLAVVPHSLVEQLEQGIRAQACAAEGVPDLHQLPADAPYRLLSADLLRFCVDNREAVLVLLAHAEGSPHAEVAARLQRLLMDLALAHARSLCKEAQASSAERFALERIYEGFFATLIAILARYKSHRGVEAALQAYLRYHHAGLRSFLRFSARTEQP